MDDTRWPKPVFFTLRSGPNFLWHVLAVARIAYDSDYADRFASSVEPESLTCLKRHSESLRFGGIDGGPLSGFFTFLPAWLHLETYNDFEAYFEAAARTLRDGLLRRIVEAFPDADWTDIQYRHFLDAPTFDAGEDMRTSFDEIRSAYLASFHRYMDEILPIANEEMKPRLRGLTEHFSKRDYIAAWEEEVGIPFTTPGYEIVLCHSNKNGPDYNSLGYGGNLFNYDKPFDRTWQFVSHEIGTHLLFDPIAGLVAAGIPASRLYPAAEVLAMFYNRRVLHLDRLAYALPRFDDERLLAFYETEHRSGHGPAEMLRRAVETFPMV